MVIIFVASYDSYAHFTPSSDAGFHQNPCRKNRRNIIGFFKPAMKKQEYIRHYFWDSALERREADSLRRAKTRYEEIYINN